METVGFFSANRWYIYQQEGDQVKRSVFVKVGGWKYPRAYNNSYISLEEAQLLIKDHIIWKDTQLADPVGFLKLRTYKRFK